ncbi:MAG: hypothetical protein WCP46_00640 [Alphaproteobacteria bacterium]
MPCTDCFNGCAEVISDKCVKYTGADNPALPICQGDSLYQLEQVIITKLLAAANGTGIVLDTPLSCTFLTTLLNGADKTLATLLDVYQQAICSLKSDVTSLQAVVGTSTSFNTSCLTGLPASPTRDQIIQALLTKVCTMDTRLTAIEVDYVKASQLNSLISSYISGNVSSVQQNTKMVPYVALPYFGPLSNFDNSGKGLSSTGFDKVYICNGSNGTPDLRGRTIVGAIQGVPGGALDSAVDPALPANAGNNYVLNQKFGASSIVLTSSQMPAHTHSITDPGHTHDVVGLEKGAGDGSNVVGAEPGTKVKTTNSSITNISIGSAGSSQAHDNRQPSLAGYFIMYLP